MIPIYGVPIQTRELFGVLHLKGHVIDDTVIYSGASINNVYLHQLDKYRHDRYWFIQNVALANSMLNWMRQYFLGASAVCRLDLPEVPATKEILSDIRAFREQLKSAPYILGHTAAITQARSLSVTSLVGVGKDNVLNRTLCQLIAAAEKQMTILHAVF